MCRLCAKGGAQGYGTLARMQEPRRGSYVQVMCHILVTGGAALVCSAACTPSSRSSSPESCVRVGPSTPSRGARPNSARNFVTSVSDHVKTPDIVQTLALKPKTSSPSFAGGHERLPNNLPGTRYAQDAPEGVKSPPRPPR